MCSDSTTPSYLAVSAGGWRLGWKDCCCGWPLLDLLATSRLKNTLLRRHLGCYVALPTVPDLRIRKNRHGKKWPYTPSYPPGLLRLALRERHRRSTYCCCGTPLLLESSWTAYTTFALWRESVYTWSQNVLRLDVSPLP